MNNIFAINDELLYMPLKKIIIKKPSSYSEDSIESDINMLSYISCISDTPVLKSKFYDFNDVFNTSLTVLLTNKCMLKCKYCYYSSGNGDSTSLNKEKIMVIINYLIRNCKMKSLVIPNYKKNCRVTLTGGGEPTADWNIFTYFVDTFIDKCNHEGIEPYIILVTNGVFDSEKLKYIVKKINFCNVSFDGLPKLHEKNRPMGNGENSFQYVYNTLKELNKNNSNFSIRATINDMNQDINEIITYVKEQFPNSKFLHLEPVVQLGRAKGFKGNEEIMRIYVNNFIDNYNKYCMNNNSIRIENVRFKYIFRDFNCSMEYGYNWHIHANGDIYPCSSILDYDDFCVGTVTDTKIIKNNSCKNKFLDVLQSVHDDCKDCFAFYHCAGGCPATYKKENDDCRLVKLFWTRVFADLVNGKKTFNLYAEKVSNIFKDEKIEMYQIKEIETC